MSVFGLAYPITTAKARLPSYPALASRLVLGEERSPFEIVRLLDGACDGPPSGLLLFIERSLVDSGPIGDRVLHARTPEAMAQALAEMYLFAYLREALGDAVTPVPESGPERGNDINVTFEGNSVLVEVFTPLELAGWQYFESNFGPTLAYLDVDLGYEISFTVEATATFPADPVRHSYYPYLFPAQQEITAWFGAFLAAVRAWLLAPAPDRVFRYSGPQGAVQIELVLEQLADASAGRSVHGVWGGRSNSTRLVFEQPGDAIAKGEWGRKLRGKLNRRQCGAATPDRLRLLVLNFRLGDEVCFEFMNSDRFASRFDEFVRQLVDPADLPYEAVLPAALGITSGFGRAVPLDQHRAALVQRFVTAGALDRQVQDPPPGDPAELFSELSTEGGDETD